MPTPTPLETSPYSAGLFTPVAEETIAPDLRVSGELPRDLAGCYVRNSSNPRFPPTGRYHWFDGDGMLQSVCFEAGRATYRNRWIRTRAFLAESEAGRALWDGVTERPDFTNPLGPFKDTANTDVVYHAGRLLSLWWLGGEPYFIALPGLETLGTERFGGAQARTVSAHPKVDAATGEMMIFDYKPYPPYLTYGVVRPDGTLARMSPIALDGPRLQHDMAITEHYSLVFDMSLRWDPALLAAGRTKARFFRDVPSRIGVLPRHGTGSEVRWFECAPFYMYHTINAWESGDEIVLLGCRIDEPLAGDPLNRPTAQEVPTIGFLRLAPRLHCWRLDLGTGTVNEESLDDAPIEFPRMDNRILGRRARYTYSPRLAASPTLRFEALVKYDHQTGTSTCHVLPRGCCMGEATFVPRADAAGEDDGYVLTFVVDEADHSATLDVFDARAIEAGPQARVHIPVRVPLGYHTWWVSAAELAAQRLP